MLLFTKSATKVTAVTLVVPYQCSCLFPFIVYMFSMEPIYETIRSILVRVLRVIVATMPLGKIGKAVIYSCYNIFRLQKIQLSLNE